METYKLVHKCGQCGGIRKEDVTSQNDPAITLNHLSNPMHRLSVATHRCPGVSRSSIMDSIGLMDLVGLDYPKA